MLLGEYGTVDKALVYNDMVILGLPLPAATTLSYAIVISKQLTPSSPGSWAGDFFFFQIACYTDSVLFAFSPPSLPTYLVENPCSVFLCPTVHTV